MKSFFVNSISRQLFAAFGILVAGITVIYIVAATYITKLTGLHDTESDVNHYRISMLELIANDQDYCRFEIINDEYFKTLESKFLTTHDSLSNVALLQCGILSERFIKNGISVPKELNEVRTTTENYLTTFDSLRRSIERRGFLNFGLEGKMRSYAHRLENERIIGLADLLMLRRHEKDYLLRRDSVYVMRFNALAAALLTRPFPDSTRSLLASYAATFNELAIQQNAIGNSDKDGLIHLLRQRTASLLHSLNYLQTRTKEESDDTIFKASVVFSLIALVTTAVCLVVIYIISIRITRPIQKLSGYMVKMMVSEGIHDKEFNSEEINEIQNLSQSFIRLLKKIRKQLNEIREQSDIVSHQNEQLIKVNEELDRFIYSAAHDLKSPLTSLDGLIRLAEIEINDPSYQEYFQRMHNAVQRLYEFIGNITNYARNKQQFRNIEEINIVEVINGIVQSLQYLPNADNLNVDVVNGASPFFCDRVRLEIVLSNIISNAYHFIDTRKHYSYLKIRIDRDRDFTKITLADNGIGIRRESLPMIFDMFYRGDETSKGTGIGLYLVKEAMKNLGGHITVKSILGEWTSFEILLPDRLPDTTEPEEFLVVEELV